jgi:hypothetical protein
MSLEERNNPLERFGQMGVTAGMDGDYQQSSRFQFRLRAHAPVALDDRARPMAAICAKALLDASKSPPPAARPNSAK